ncbi:hypothetical protein D9758_009160 [Tetrapyrgos nigripes]|uniref:MYND-type domain-containing protein n=1 Tax=Tetrapyrgos nigripes TaxID=182062 RepID=A0A8H5LKA6_9AGAR|nr:hypothetical protein D9758_009160 [Tetrapyrgos nigripes]
MPTGQHSSRTATISAAYQHFHRPVPSFIDSSSSRDLEHTLLYLNVLANHTRDTTRDRRASIAEYVEEWTNIWSWTSALVKYFLEGWTTEHGLAFRDRFLNIFPRIVSLDTPGPGGDWDLEQPSSLSLMKNSNPDVYRFILAVWMFAVNTNHPSLHSMFYLVEASLVISSSDMKLFWSNCRTIGLSSNVVKPLFSYISTTVQNLEDHALHCLQTAFRFIYGFVKEAPGGLMRRFLTKETLTSLNSSFKLLPSPRRFAKLTPHAAVHSVEYLKYILGILTDAFDLHGPSAIVLVLRANVVRSVMYTSSLIAYDKENGSPPEIQFKKTLAQSFADFLELLPRYLCYHRVLDPVLQLLKKEIPAHRSLEGIPNAKPSAFHPNYSHFRDVLHEVKTHAFEIKALRDEFEQEGLVICANPECPDQGMQTHCKFSRKQCSRCQVTTYCSKTCQRQDWKTYEHRVKCDMYCEGTLGLKNVLTDVDQQFMEWYTLHQTRVHRKTIGSLLRQQKTAMQILFMDFRKTTTPAFFVTTIDRYTVDAWEHSVVDEALSKEECDAQISEFLAKIRGFRLAGYQTVVHGIYPGENYENVSFILSLELAT